MDPIDNTEICSMMEETEEVILDSDSETMFDNIGVNYLSDAYEMGESVFGDDSFDDICADIDLSDIENIKDDSTFDIFNTNDCGILGKEDLTSELHFLIPDKLEQRSFKNGRIRDESKWKKAIERLEKKESRKGKRRKIPNCRCKCSQKMSEDEQLKVHKSFFDLETNDEQNIFLRKSVTSSPPQRRRSRKGTNKPRRVFNYYFNSGNRKITVCLSAFISVLGIKRSRLMKKVQSPSAESSVIDGRGKHGKQKKIIDVSVKQRVQIFLEKLPTFGSRYIISEDKIEKYLHSELNILDLHRNFIESYDSSITYQSFRSLFRNKLLQYSFCFDRCNSCKICQKSNVYLDTTQKELHIERAHQFFEILRSYKEFDSSENLVICFDYQNDLPIPVTNTSNDYYKHHLKIHNFGIHNVITNTTDMFMYSEHFARKEVDEVLSCLDYYIHQNQKNYKKLVIFCENCCNQTKNEFFFAYLDQLCALNVFRKIIVFYPTSGHSFMPIHTKFESVEKKIKVLQTIYSPEQYVEAVKKTRCGKRFSVHYVENTLVPSNDEEVVKVLNWKDYYNQFINSPISGIWNCRTARFTSGHDPVIKSTYNGSSNQLNLYKSNNFQMERPLKKYSNFLPISSDKLNDIKYLLENSGQISDRSNEFYSSISTSIDAEDMNIDAYE